MALFISGHQLLLISEICLRFGVMVTVDRAHAVGAFILGRLLARVLNDLLGRVAQRGADGLATIGARCSQALDCWHGIQSTIVASSSHAIAC